MLYRRGLRASILGYPLSWPRCALIVAGVVAAILLIRGQGDFVASDPLWYADIANNLATNPSRVFAAKEVHPFVMRLGLTGPLALIYMLFGVSTVSSNMPAVLAALVIICIVYAAAPTTRAKLLGLIVSVFALPLLRSGTILNVDLPCAALLAASIYCLSRRHESPQRWACCAVGAWFAAFLVKETAIWAAPIWVYVGIVDVRAYGLRRLLRTYLPALLLGLALSGAYLYLCAAIWNDPLARFRGIDELTNEHAWRLQGQPAEAWMARLTWQPAVLLAKMFGIGLAVLIFGHWFVRGRERIWLVSAWFFVLLYWFGSSSLSAYSPLPISERMALPIAPPLLVALAVTIDGAFNRLRRRWVPVVLLCAVVAPGCARAVRMLHRAQPETTAFAIVREHVLQDANTRYVLVCAEPRCTSIASFHFKFEIPSNLRVVFAGDQNAFLIDPTQRVMALVNRARAHGARHTDPASDFTRVIDHAGFMPMYCAKSVCLYDAGDGARLREILATNKS